MVRPSKQFRTAAKDYVCVRVTDMRDVDLSVFRFDYDLTFAALLMHPDGTVYHRFAGRDHESATSWITLPGLVRVMRDTLAEHAQYSRDPHPPAARPKRTIADYPTFARKLEQQNVECVHCHMINDERHASAVERGAWSPDDIWIWPEPQRVGLELDPGDPPRVAAVGDGSPADHAGLEAGDRLERVGDQRVRTAADVQWVLEREPFGEAKIPVVFRRGGAARSASLSLAPGWKVGTPLSFSWRPSKWNLEPAPGFGGPMLDAQAKRRLGLEPDAFAFRVQYLVTWGPKARTGNNARRAGLRQNDVVIAVGGKRDFASVAHFHAWVRLTKRVGDELEIRVLRDGRELTIDLELVGSR